MEKIGTINGLRGFAIISVIYYHLFSIYTYPGWINIPIGEIVFFPLSFLSNGWIGVNLFFILSGFVLYLPYASGLRRMDSEKDAVSFYKRRARRLLPLYYISVLPIMFLLWNIHNDPDFIFNLFFMLTGTFNFTTYLFCPKYNSDLWSIGIEILFSALFPFLLLEGRKVSVYRLFMIASVIGLAARVIGVSTEYFEFGSPYQNALKDSILGRLDDFVLGMVICRMYVDGKIKRTVHPFLFIIAGALLVFIGCNLWDYNYLGLMPKLYTAFINNILHAGFFLIVYAALASEKGALSAVFTNRPVQIMGMMSYSLYVWHHLALRLIMRTDYGLFSPTQQYHYTPLNLTYYFAFLFVFSILTYRYIEFGKKDVKEIFLLKNA